MHALEQLCDSNTMTRICLVAVVARVAEYIQSLMTRCENRRRDGSGGPAVNVGFCDCPVAIMRAFGMTLDQLTYAMAQQQPTVWSDPGQYCGDAARNCAAPNCIPLPR